MLSVSCSEEETKFEQLDTQNEWLVDQENVTGLFSLFPLVVNTEFESVANTNLSDNELVGIMNFGSEVRVYPYLYTFENEVVNDSYQNQDYAFSYCPITKSAIAFHRNQVFRASGYLYKDNLTPWDEKTESIWSQMLLKGIRGEKKNQRLNTIPVVETKWETIKTHFPKAKVIRNLAGSLRQSGKNEPPEIDDELNPESKPQAGDFVYGVLDEFDNVNIFKYNDFSDKNRIDVTIGSQNYIIYGSSSKRIINAFKVANFDRYQTLDNDFPFVLQDDAGVKYNILGIGTNGSVLQKPKYAYVAIWRAWEDFYTNFDFQ